MGLEPTTSTLRMRFRRLTADELGQQPQVTGFHRHLRTRSNTGVRAMDARWNSEPAESDPSSSLRSHAIRSTRVTTQLVAPDRQFCSQRPMRSGRRKGHTTRHANTLAHRSIGGIVNVGPAELVIVFAVLGIPILVIVGLVLLVSSSRRAGRADPLATLDDRLARGEISPDEYDERRSRLR